MAGLLESLGGLVERARGFLSGIFGQAAREEIEWPTISEALEAGGLELEIPELSEDFLIQQRQTELSDSILASPLDQLIPGDMHLETDRLLPHRYAYEVEITQILEDGTTQTNPFYVGSDKRLTPEEILDVADSEAEQYAEEGAVAYEVGGITASWYSPGGGRS
jgi:hypothetical protein